MGMDEKRLESLVAELGFGDEWMGSEIEAQAAASGVGDIVGANADPLTRFLRTLFTEAWAKIMVAVRALLPQLFLRYATGHWLDEHAQDNGLKRDPGTKTKLTFDLTKDAGLPFTVPAGTVIYPLEASPRRYQTLVDVSPADGTTDFTVQTEALCPSYVYDDGRTFYQSAKYNPATGLNWACESALPLNSIAFTGVPDVYGTDPETDTALRARIFSLRDLKNFELGCWLFYERLLKTVAGVVHVTLDATDPNTGSMNMTLYGETGQLPQPILDEAQALFDAKKMLTDHGNLSQATPLGLDLTVLYANGGTGAEVNQKVADFFQGLYNGTHPGITRGTSFEASDLHDYLQETWPDLRSRITPTHQALPTGKYFVPTTTTGAL